jgi:hypothetical protein
MHDNPVSDALNYSLNRIDTYEEVLETIQSNVVSCGVVSVAVIVESQDD